MFVTRQECKLERKPETEGGSKKAKTRWKKTNKERKRENENIKERMKTGKWNENR